MELLSICRRGSVRFHRPATFLLTTQPSRAVKESGILIGNLRRVFVTPCAPGRSRPALARYFDATAASQGVLEVRVGGVRMARFRVCEWQGLGGSAYKSTWTCTKVRTLVHARACGISLPIRGGVSVVAVSHTINVCGGGETVLGWTLWGMTLPVIL